MDLRGKHRMGSRLARHATLVACLFALTWAAGQLLNLAVGGLWHLLSEQVGRVFAVAVLVLVLAGVSVAVAVLQGYVRVPARGAQLRLAWAVRQLPFAVRDAIGGRSVSRGSSSRRWASLEAFEAEDQRRGNAEEPQSDYGKGWRDGDERVQRITHVHATGEVVAVYSGPDEAVELLGMVSSERELDSLLDGWAYAAFGGRDLRWVRCRMHGWRLPLPPRGAWSLEQDQKPPKPWPPPPEASVDRKTGAYHGRHVEHEREVVCVDETGQRALYHAVDSSPTGYSWGYSGSGPHDMARSLLRDRLGYVPQLPVVSRFAKEIVARLPASFTLTYAEVDAWIDEHTELFAANPRAVPLDLLAAGGAYDE